MNPITIKELISELGKYDPDSIVLYAYDEYGRTATHGFCASDLSVIVDVNGSAILDERGEVIFFETTNEDLSDDILNILEKNKRKEAIMLYPF